MKGTSLSYLTREGFKNIWVNRLLSLATVVVLISCLIIVGSGTLIYLNINSLLDIIEGQNIVMAYVDDNADDVATQMLGVELRNLPNVANVEFVSKEDALKRQIASYGENMEILNGLPEDILPDAYKITVDDLTLFDETVEKIRGLDNVLEIQENSELAAKLANIRDAVTYISLGIVSILFFVSLFIVSNTIRITIFNRRLEISIMKAVGATNSFIRWPFVVEGVLLGVISAVIALGVEYGIYEIASIWLENILGPLGGKPVEFLSAIWLILAVFLFIGVFIGAFGSAISLNKYLKEHGNVVESN
ncbi:MAG: permease-like cell division protein FtsX [Oscillospiraceae bacterium]|nr:permease-like cell division protein FtsX [Oscillospiraceae bacterium]MDD7470309.1 permease-like cell division protein FtsX [Oscillospiraceae bacterium]MDY2678556.1 permease-like cell division protein FtsX [Oscillospiraceae bacterium]